MAKRRIANFIVGFVQSPDKDTPSPLALLCQSIASIFGQQISLHLKATFLGLQSVDIKNERREVAGNIISGNSVLAAIMASFPAVGKKMGKNPAMAALANMAISKFTGGTGGNEQSSGSNGSNEQVKFKLGGF